jgi:hypothetical protein
LRNEAKVCVRLVLKNEPNGWFGAVELKMGTQCKALPHDRVPKAELRGGRAAVLRNEAKVWLVRVI